MIEKYYKILYLIHKHGFSSQRTLAKQSDMSVGSVNNSLKMLHEEGYLKKSRDDKNGYVLTKKGQVFLEEMLESKQEEKLSLDTEQEVLPIRSAVILAAGKNDSFDIAPSLLIIDGIPVIEWMIRNLNQNGIEHVYIVVGFKKEAFEEYFHNRSNVTLIENERYKWTGTMASLSLAGEMVTGDFLLLEGNQILDEIAVIKMLRANEQNSVLLTNPSDSGDEALVELKSDGSIFRISKDIRQLNSIDAELVGVSRISSALFGKMLEYYQENNNPLLNYEYVIESIGRIYQIAGIMADDMTWTVIENEEHYRKAETLIFPKIRKKIRLRKENYAKETLMQCMELREDEIEECSLGGGMTNTNFFVRFHGKQYILRMPGAGTDVMIDRRSEQHNAALAAALGINPYSIYFDVKSGVKVTECIQDAETLNNKTARLEINIKGTSKILKNLHSSEMKMYGNFRVQTEYEKYKKKIRESHGVYYPGFDEVDTFFYWLMDRLELLGLEQKPCHNDLVAENFIRDKKGRLFLIDWEYSGYNDPMWDLAGHLAECDFKTLEEELFLQYYFGRPADEVSKEKIFIFKICQDVLWSAWTVLKEAEGEDFGSYGIDRLARAIRRREEYHSYYGK